MSRLLISCGKVRLKHEETGGKVSWKQEVILVCLTNIRGCSLGRVTWDCWGSKSLSLVGIGRPFGVCSLDIWRLRLMSLGEFDWETVEN